MVDERKRYSEAQYRQAERTAEMLGEQKGARETINEFFNDLGVNPTRVDEVQELRRRLDFLREMYEGREELAADQRWVRPLRQGSSNAARKVGMLMVVSAFTGIAAAVFVGFRAMFIKWLG